MKKNADYVGVNEEFIPEDEKYIDNTANSEVTDTINEGVKAAKSYIDNPANQEKIKKTAKKGLKIFKGIGLGYLIFFGIITLMVIIGFIVGIVTFVKISNKATSGFDNISERIEDNNNPFNN